MPTGLQVAITWEHTCAHLCVCAYLSLLLCQAPGWGVKPTAGQPERVVSLGRWAEQGPFMKEPGSARENWGYEQPASASTIKSQAPSGARIGGGGPGKTKS